MTLSIEAFHGTSLESAKEIEASNYRESDRDDEWLGKGIYFFVDGISDPLTNAIDWAIAQAWDNAEKIYKYKEFAVLKSTVEVDENRLIDLTSQEGLRNFNSAKLLLLKEIFKGFASEELKEMSVETHSCKVFNFIVAKFNAHAVKHNLYINNKKGRRMNLKSNVPNTTVLCVRRENFNFNAQICYRGVVS